MQEERGGIPRLKFLRKGEIKAMQSESEIEGLRGLQTTPTKVTLSGNLEGEDYGLKVSIDA
jgi:hypothetical protein